VGEIRLPPSNQGQHHTERNDTLGLGRIWKCRRSSAGRHATPGMEMDWKAHFVADTDLGPSRPAAPSRRFAWGGADGSESTWELPT
jgi:hypothetical protein